MSLTRAVRYLAVLAVCLFPSCAAARAATEPISQAPTLLAYLAPELEVTAASECPDWIKLDTVISDSSDFVAKMNACRDRPVAVEINSPGGSIFDALEIQKAIERHPHPVLCVVDGMAASAAFVTLQSCDLRTMTNRSVLMAHHASVPRAGGQSQDLDNVARALEAIDRAATLHCAKRMEMSPEAFEAKVSGGREWWMALDGALASHAVDFEVSGIGEALALVRQVPDAPAPDAGTP